MLFFFFFFNDTATTEIYTLSLHDALPIWKGRPSGIIGAPGALHHDLQRFLSWLLGLRRKAEQWQGKRSEEHTSELQSRLHLVCRLLLEKKKTQISLLITGAQIAASHALSI